MQKKILLQSNLYLEPPLHNRYFFCPGGQKKLIHTLTLYWIDHHGDLTPWQGIKQLGLTFQLISTPSLPTQPMEGCTTALGSMPPTLYEQQCGFFYLRQESKQWKSCETGPMVFRPYPRRLEILTVCRCHNKRQHILLRCFKTLSVGLAVVWTCDLLLSRPALKVTGRWLTSPQWPLSSVPNGDCCEEVQLYLRPVQWQVKNLFPCIIISKPLQTNL